MGQRAQGSTGAWNEFCDRTERLLEVPDHIEIISDEFNAARERIARQTEELIEARETLERYAQITHVLS